MLQNAFPNQYSMFQNVVPMPRPGVALRVHLDSGQEQLARARRLRAAAAGRRGHPPRTVLPQGGHRVPLAIRAHCESAYPSHEVTSSGNGILQRNIIIVQLIKSIIYRNQCLQI